MCSHAITLHDKSRKILTATDYTSSIRRIFKYIYVNSKSVRPTTLSQIK